MKDGAQILSVLIGTLATIISTVAAPDHIRTRRRETDLRRI